MRSRLALWSLFLVTGGATSTTCLGAPPKVLEPAQVAAKFTQRSWQHEHGLPGDRVHAVLQARDGYLWLGGQYGLLRFDGRTFTVFDHVNTPALANNDCRALAEDTEGNLWTGTKGGLVRKAGNQFTSFADQVPAPSGDWWPLAPARAGGVWAGGDGSLRRVHGGTVRVYAQDQAGLTDPGTITCLAEDQNGFVWVGTTTGLDRFDIQRAKFERVEVRPGFGHFPVLAMWKAAGGQLWILFTEFFREAGKPLPRNGIACVEPGRWPRQSVTHEHWFGPISQHGFITGDAEGTLWLAGGRGVVHRYVDGEEEILPILPVGTQDPALCMLPDREGGLWVGTDNVGLQRWTPRLVSTFGSRDGLAHDNAWSIWETRDGGVLIGTDGGVTRVQDGRTTTFRRPDGSVHENVRAVVEDLEGTIWVGTMRSLERIYDGVSSPVRLPGEWFEEKIRVLLPGQDGSMWVGTVRGLTRLHGEERTKYTRADGLGSDEVRALLWDRSGDLWVGTLGGGLSRLHDGRFTTLGTTNGLSSDKVWALHEDADGVLWIGTENGLNCLRDGKISAFTMAQGLPHASVNMVISDTRSRLWVGNDRGIYTLEKEQLLELAQHERALLNAISYDESDGLLSPETNGQKSNPTVCKTRDGRLWFPTAKGVAIFDPGKAPHKPVPPLAAIEEVRANGKLAFSSNPQVPIANDSAEVVTSRTTELSLPPGGARVLEFRYTANTFLAAEKATFKYRLVGLDDHWIDARTRRQAYFTDLRPGEYRFELMAGDHHGVWQENSVTMAFHVAAFYYETWWFYVLCGTCATTLVAGAVVWRARALRRIYQLERINALNEQRRQIARDIHDELGSSLTHIMQLADASRSAAPANRIPLHTERIASIAGEAVDNIGDIVWVNNPEYDTLEDLTAYLREHAACFFADSGIRIELDFPESVPSRSVSGWFRRHLVLVMKEALHNVSKHAAARRVTVRLALPDGQLELFVGDDGKGLPTEGTRRFGAGLTNMRLRVTELRGNFELTSQPGKGTQIRVVVPLEAPLMEAGL